MKKGTFFVLSGPSGSGKGTVLKEVLRKSDRIVYSVSGTSRSPRAVRSTVSIITSNLAKSSRRL